MKRKEESEVRFNVQILDGLSDAARSGLICGLARIRHSLRPVLRIFVSASIQRAARDVTQDIFAVEIEMKIRSIRGGPGSGHNRNTPRTAGGWCELLTAFMLLLTMGFCGRSSAYEIGFQPLPIEKPPQRRLSIDPARPIDAPEALLIEVAGIQDDPETALRVAIKAYNASSLAYGRNDTRRIVPVINLGVARLRAGGPIDAMRDFRSAIDLASTVDSPRDPRLGEAYYGLGSAHFDLGQWPAAIGAFEDGLQQQRVHSGLYSESQIDFLRALALSNRALGKIRAADQWQERRIEVAERVFQTDAARMAWTYVDAGRWFRDGGRLNDAVALHARAVNVIEAGYGPNTPLLVGPLLDLAISGALRSSESGLPPVLLKLGPVSTLDRARRLVLSDHGTGAADRAKVLERVGDVHWILGRRKEALTLYVRAQELGPPLATVPGFDVPAFLVFHPPTLARNLPLPEGHVLAEFAVDKQGRARDIEIAESVPSYFSETLGPRLLAALRSAKLRPRIVDGKAVAMAGVRYRIEMPVKDERSPRFTSVAKQGLGENSSRVRPG
ncbi:MAG: hypothetical protein ACT4QA_15810 [Panacagrimonas sp.]